MQLPSSKTVLAREIHGTSAVLVQLKKPKGEKKKEKKGMPAKKIKLFPYEVHAAYVTTLPACASHVISNWEPFPFS
jgi:hypothetical protein